MNILFVSHAANRSGAPLVLLELLRYLKRHTAHRATVLCLRDGPLLDEFARVAQVLSSEAALVRLSKLGAARRRLNSFEGAALARFEPSLLGLERLQSRQARAAARRFEGDFDLLYLNSLAAGDVLAGLEPLARRVPVVTHVHELRWVADGLKSAFDLAKSRSDWFVAASDAVRVYLESRAVAPQKIAVVHEFVDFEALRTDRATARVELRAKARLAPDAWVVGGCGKLEWRKGADWWAPLIAQTPGAQFVWLGGQKGEFLRQMEFDLARFGVRERTHFLPPTTQTAPFFAGLDAFALPSREDPFPLVGIEAAAQGVPLACFAGAGGLSELVRDDAGIVAPYGDVGAMARALQSWRADPSERAALGARAQHNARQMCDVNVAAPRLIGMLEKLVKA